LMLFQKFSKRFYSGECAPVATKYKTSATHTHHACMHGPHTYQMDSNAISKEVKEILLLSVRNSVEEKVCTKVIYPMQTTVCFFFPQRALPEFHYQGNEITEIYQFVFTLQSSLKTECLTVFKFKITKNGCDEFLTLCMGFVSARVH
jgi:hypothetical protein